MTVALVTAPLTPNVLAALEVEFGWQVLKSRGPALLKGDGFEPAAVGALLVESEPVDRQVLERFPELSVVGCVRGNPVNVDIEMATKLGIVVIGSPARNAESVADLVLGLMLSVLRHIAQSHHLVVSRELTEDREGVQHRKDVVWRPSDPAAPVPYTVYKGAGTRYLDARCARVRGNRRPRRSKGRGARDARGCVRSFRSPSRHCGGRYRSGWFRRALQAGGCPVSTCAPTRRAGNCR